MGGGGGGGGGGQSTVPPPTKKKLTLKEILVCGDNSSAKHAMLYSKCFPNQHWISIWTFNGKVHKMALRQKCYVTLKQC